MDQPIGGSLHHVHQLVTVAGLQIELLSFADRSLIDREIFGTAQIRAAKGHLCSRFEWMGLTGVRVYYFDVADLCHKGRHSITPRRDCKQTACPKKPAPTYFSRSGPIV